MRQSIAALLLACLLVTSGCAGLLGEERSPSDQRAQDALNRSRAALADVSSYRARNDGFGRMTGDDREITADVRGEVLVNVTSREMRSNGRVDDPSNPLPGVRRTYVDNYTVLTECRLAGWGREELSTSRDWFAYTPIGEQFAMLSRSPVYWEGRERLNGTQVAVVEAHPTKEELLAVPSVWTLEPEDPEQANFQNATVRVWLSTETWLPLQIMRESHWKAGGARVTLSTTWRYDGYDEPANVTRPSVPDSEIRDRSC
ncbi:MAG: hypothetical protein U5J98_04290 [Halobacteriales archaeon]|nr:hypothetical protein [Halobacteriales archaeon]